MKVFVSYLCKVAFQTLRAGRKGSEGTEAGAPKADGLSFTPWSDTPTG